jgi:hypothetical protein
MLMTPAPVGLLIVVVELGKDDTFAMAFLYPHAIRLIFMIIPLMIVIVSFVVVDDLMILGAQRCGDHCDWGYQNGAQQDGIQETGHDYSPNPEIRQLPCQAFGDGCGERND